MEDETQQVSTQVPVVPVNVQSSVRTNERTVEKLYWPLEKLHNWESNPREISREKFADLVTSLKAEGQLIPLLVDVRPDHQGEVLGGNMTLRALTQLGVKQVWVEPRTPRDDAHAFELAIKHNMSYGTYNAQQVAELGQRYIDQLDLTKLDVNLSLPSSIDEVLAKFSPAGGEPQPQLDEKNDVTCPECGAIFKP